MNYFGIICSLYCFTIMVSCSEKKSVIEILQKTVESIDTIETIYFKQDMSRTNPRNVNDTIRRYREMYFRRLISDSIVGVKGHWYMYLNGKEDLAFEDIYDGNRLIRKNNRDSVARIYDLVKYPDFIKKHFWGHNTLYGMQHEFKFIMNNTDSYILNRLKDTIINNKQCYQIKAQLENKMTLPGFHSKLENDEGTVSNTFFYIEKEMFYPIGVKGESYSIDHPEKKIFINQRYYDIKFNTDIDDNVRFNTSKESIAGFEIKEMKP